MAIVRAGWSGISLLFSGKGRLYALVIVEAHEEALVSNNSSISRLAIPPARRDLVEVRLEAEPIPVPIDGQEVAAFRERF